MTEDELNNQNETGELRKHQEHDTPKVSIPQSRNHVPLPKEDLVPKNMVVTIQGTGSLKNLGAVGRVYKAQTEDNNDKQNKRKKQLMKLTTLEVARHVDNEGLDYSIVHGLNSDNFEDSKLRKVWSKARKALLEIEDMLEEALEEALDEFGAE